MGRFFSEAFWLIGLAALPLLALIASLLTGLFEGWRAAGLFGAWLFLTFFSLYSLKSRLAQSWLCWDGHDWQVQTVLSLATQSVSVAPSPAPSTHLNQPLIGSPLDGGYAIRVHLDFQQYLLFLCSTQQPARSGFGLQSAHSLSVGMDFVALYIRNQNKFSVQRLNWSLGSL